MGNQTYRQNDYVVPRVGTAVPAAGTLLFNPATGAYNIPIGGFGIFTRNTTGTSMTPQTVPAVPTLANTPYFNFIQRFDVSALRSPLNGQPMPYYETQKVTPSCDINVRGLAAAPKNLSAWLIGSSASPVPVNDETEYIIDMTMRGYRTDMLSGVNTNVKTARFVTPEYFASTLYTVAGQRLDHLLVNLVYNANNIQTNQEYVALAIDTAGVAGTGTTLTAIAALPVGTQLIIGYQNDGSAVTLDLDVERLRTFALLAAALPVASEVVPFALPTAANLAVGGRVVAGGRTAGDNLSRVDRMLILPINHVTPTYDEMSNTKDSIRVGVRGGFDNASSTQVLAFSEGSGYGKDLLVDYRGWQAPRFYANGKNWSGHYVEYPNEIVEGAIYDVFNISFCNNLNTTSHSLYRQNYVTRVCILNTTTAGFTGFTGVANPQKAYVQNFLNAYMALTSFQFTPLAL